MRGVTASRIRRVAVMVVLTLGALSVTGGMAGAETYPLPEPPPEAEVEPAAEAPIAPVTVPDTGGGLPLTGGDVAQLLVIAGLATGGGVALLRLSHRPGVRS